MRVAENGDQATARLLLEWGAAIDATDENGWTPLMYAAEQEHEVAMKLQLTRDDVDRDSKNSMGRTPLARAALDRHEAMVEPLFASDDIDPSHYLDFKSITGAFPSSP